MTDTIKLVKGPRIFEDKYIRLRNIVRLREDRGAPTNTCTIQAVLNEALREGLRVLEIIERKQFRTD